MKSDILLYIEIASTDGELTFMGSFMPDALAARLRGNGSTGEVYYSLPDSYQGKLSADKHSMVRTGSDDVEFWKSLFAKTGAEHICKIYADSAFLDPVVIQEMLDMHLKYRAEFTYSENLPSGFSCEIVSGELISALPDIKEKTLPLAQVVKTNINQFDIEIFYKDPDIRDKRLSFRASNPRDKRIMENIYRQNTAVPSYPDIKAVIEQSPETLYIGPSYLEIELSGKCDLNCIFCYRNTLKQEHGAMPPGTFDAIIGQMRSFNLPYTVCFGGSGEPMMNPDFYRILASANNDPLIETIIVETNGIYADVNYRNYLVDAGTKIRTIVNINGINAETYRSIHGKDCFDQVSRNVLDLKEIAGNRLYVQIMKIRETEPFLDAYYDFWEKQKISIILQKQNVFLGRVPDRRYSDLSPLDRVPCWHLQRDLYVTADGTVCYCKQDVDAAWAYGTVSSTTIADIWEKKKDAFLRDYNKKFPAAPDCKSCDEWYTFNA